MRIPGFNAERSLLLGSARVYRGSLNPTRSSRNLQPAGWGYSPFTSYPGERCINRLVCRWNCTGPSAADCGWFCDYHCLYPIVPLPTAEPGNPVPLP
jgi:hypothetical protein